LEITWHHVLRLLSIEREHQLLRFWIHANTPELLESILPLAHFSSQLAKNELMAISIPIILYNSENIYIDPKLQMLMGPLSILSNLSIWCQVIFKIKNAPSRSKQH